MIIQIIGWFCLLMGCLSFIGFWFGDDRDNMTRSALFSIAAAICFK